MATVGGALIGVGAAGGGFEPLSQAPKLRTKIAAAVRRFITML
jgi:hypothetical protein